MVSPVSSRPATSTTLGSAVEIQVAVQTATSTQQTAIHFDGCSDYVPDCSTSRSAFQTVGTSDEDFYSSSDYAESLSECPSSKSLIEEPTSLVGSYPNASLKTVRGTRRCSRPLVARDFATIVQHFPINQTSLQHRPSLATMEKVASVKAFFETYYSEHLRRPSSQRTIRRRRLRSNLHQSSVTASEQEQLFGQLQQAESSHLRHLRVLKTNAYARHNTRDVGIAGFHEIRVLGKGSFGVVKLVTDTDRALTREESASQLSTSSGITLRECGTSTPRSLKNLYAMKVIRKSEMIHTGQEAHLRAERDFLVKSEGSQ